VEGTPNAFVPFALAAFVVLSLVAFSRMPRRRAVLVTLLGGLLFLPVFGGGEESLVPLLRDKAMFVPGVVLATAVVFDLGRWRRFRLRLVDLPFAVFCLAPIATSLANDLGLYDGLQAAFQLTISWGAPYLLGRVYLGDREGLEQFASAVVLAGLVYLPFCLWEVRMSPNLHYYLYGYRPHAGFGQSVRFGGFRPSVFMDHGLMLGMFLAGAAMLSFWLWRTGARRQIAGLPMGWVTLSLVAGSLLTKSVGSNILLLAGLIALGLTRRLQVAVLVLSLALVPAAYATARVSGWSAESVVQLVRTTINPDRAQSVDFRLWNEKLLINKALERPALGWGRWGRGRVYDEDGRDISTTDGLWILALSTGGLTSLAALLLMLALPVLLLWRTVPIRFWSSPRFAASAALGVWLLLFAIDALANAMLTPVFPLVAGGLTSLALHARAATRRSPRRARAGEARPSMAGGHAG